MYGKIRSINKADGSSIACTYDASGNRISKTVYASAGVTGSTTYYVRDASGNVMAVYESSPATAGNLTQKEVHLYGSSRLGIKNCSVNVQGGNLLLSSQGYAVVVRGDQFFELSNHLGNVLVTVSDKKIQQSAGGITVDYYTADVVTANDYYPFGMLMPGRKLNSDKYRFSMNGQEKDAELNENITTALYFEYDSRLGRRWNVDPKPTVGVSSYACFLNNPIVHIDVKGDTGELPESVVLRETKSNYWYAGRISKFKYRGTIESNPVENIPNAVGNLVISGINGLLGLWDDGVDIAKHINEGDFVSYSASRYKQGFNGISNGINGLGAGFYHLFTTPVNQQLSETLTQINNPEGFETQLAFFVPYANPFLKTAVGTFVEVNNFAKIAAYQESYSVINSKFGNKPRSVSALYDHNTGIIYLGYSGAIKNIEAVHDKLKQMLPPASFEKWKTFNCAECDALNNALLGGSKLDNVIIHTVKIGKGVKDFNTCQNCSITTQGLNVTSNQ